jgi:hypothetical protein
MGKTTRKARKMNKIEFVFGVAVLVFSVLSILFINFGGVVPSRFFPGHYTYSDLVGLSFFSFLLVPIVGFVAFGHGIYRKRFRELGLGIVILLWGFCTWLWISMCLIDGRTLTSKGR